MSSFHNVLMLTNNRKYAKNANKTQNTKCKQINKETYQHFPLSTLENVSANNIKLMKQI